MIVKFFLYYPAYVQKTWADKLLRVNWNKGKQVDVNENQELLVYNQVKQQYHIGHLMK
jgi:hypothetical protein